MGTRADFYVGRGKDAEWLGSIAYDGHPETRLPELVASTEAQFRSRVEAILASEQHATLPAQGWPWPWTSSHLTDYAYAFDGEVWTSHYNSRWMTRGEALDPERCADAGEDGAVVVFPDMTQRQAVTFGHRSGVLIFRVP